MGKEYKNYKFQRITEKLTFSDYHELKFRKIQSIFLRIYYKLLLYINIVSC